MSDNKRIIKKPAELKNIEKAQRITEKIFRVLKAQLKYGITEHGIARSVRTLAHEFGADGLSFPPIIAIAENSTSPHHRITNRKLKRGDMILIDIGTKYAGYNSDMTRIIFTKPPTTEQTKIYNLVLRAQAAAIKNLRPGIAGNAADELARNIIRKAGYEKNFKHSLGHGVGLNIHELPRLSKKYKKRIPAGAVVTVEPGIYLPGKFGVRIEDMVVIGKNGVRNLTRSPKSLKSCVVKLK